MKIASTNTCTFRDNILSLKTECHLLACLLVCHAFSEKGPTVAVNHDVSMSILQLVTLFKLFLSHIYIHTYGYGLLLSLKP